LQEFSYGCSQLSDISAFGYKLRSWPEIHRDIAKILAWMYGIQHDRHMSGAWAIA
jgi:hypothetical protein